ncbi:hypothetical protein [Streptomyces mirabilis]|uniref:hypothetical protein n=1 Tax=Streptomyces mirabilis TaxID=68239 RepID=UPI0036C2DAFC
MGNIREFPPELERQLVKAKEWYDEIYVLGDPDAIERRNAEAAEILEEIVAIADTTWGWA